MKPPHIIITNFKRHQLIVPDNRLRPIDPDYAAQIADSIVKIGLQHPIIVRQMANGMFELISGLHRLAALDLLGIDHITASVVDKNLSDSQMRLMEIDENLCRHKLTPLDRMRFLAERKRVYEQLYPETKRGVAGATKLHKKCATDTMSVTCFTESTAEKLDISERTIRRCVAAYTALEPFWDELRNSPIHAKTKNLYLLSQVPADKIRSVLHLYHQAQDPDVPKSERRFKSLNMCITAVCDPDKLPANLAGMNWTERKTHTLSKAFDALTDEAIAVWVTQPQVWDRLTPIMDKYHDLYLANSTDLGDFNK